MKVLLLCLMIACLPWAGKTMFNKRLRRVSCECGWRNGGRVFGGQATRKNEYPWMVSLNMGCGASIITHYHLLTAAHCTYGRNPKSIIAFVGKHYGFSRNDYMNYRYVYKTVPHHGYNHAAAFPIHDISVVVLASPIKFNKFVGPVCMPVQRYLLDGQYVKITGWGLTENKNPSDVLREVDVQAISINNCKRSWTKLGPLGSQMCTLTPRKDACNGDSGGPVVYLDPETRRYTQVGVVSYGQMNCGARAVPNVNTDVSDHVGWIHQTIQQQPIDNFCYKI